jgi:hypothetical protein
MIPSESPYTLPLNFIISIHEINDPIRSLGLLLLVVYSFALD